MVEKLLKKTSTDFSLRRRAKERKNFWKVYASNCKTDTHRAQQTYLSQFVYKAMRIIISKRKYR